MDIDRANRWLSLTANLGVIVGLVFLAYEIRQNTNALYAQSRETVVSVAQQELHLQIQDPQIVESMVNNGILTVEENIKLNAFMVSFMRGREFAWLQYQDQIIDSSQWNTELVTLKTVLRPTRNRTWWERLGRHAFSAEFVDFVDTQIQDEAPNDEFIESILDWSK